MLLFGTGGYLVEVFKDRALGLPPLNRTLARRLMERTQIYSALKRIFVDAAPIDLAALEELLVRFSQLVDRTALDQGNRHQSPSRFAETNRRAGCARGLARSANTRSRAPTIANQAISDRLRDDAKNRRLEVTIRPIRPEDEPLMVKFHKTLSDRSVHLRYFGLVSLERRIMHERLRRVCFIDYDREIALVADLKNRDGTHQILGVGRLIKEHGTNEAEFAVLISDPWQGKGFGSELLKLLVQVGRKELCVALPAIFLRRTPR